MNLALARRVGEQLLARFEPYCERVELAGSIRRGKPEVKDIEIVCIPRWEEKVVQDGLFADLRRVNLLHEAFAGGVPQSVGDGRPGPVQVAEGVSGRPIAAHMGSDELLLRWIKPGVSHVEPWTIYPDGKYWRGLSLVGSACKVDVFLTVPERWGTILAIRTGAGDFSKALAGHALRVRHKLSGGGLFRVVEGKYCFVPTPEETDFFAALGLQWVEPCERESQHPLYGRGKESLDV